MGRENPADLPVEDWLKTIGIEGLCPWDVLVFLYRHPISLVSAEQIARLLGYANGAVVAALDSLESLGFVERSRAAQGVRLYKFTTPGDRPREGLERLMSCADSRNVRLWLTKAVAEGGPDQTIDRSHSQGEGRAKWLKAI